MGYTPGLHILAEIKCSDKKLLADANAAKKFFHELTAKHQLQSLGEVFHSFGGGGGFTGVICLTESHLSIHTWPEYGMITFDVFLSNYQKENDDTARAMLDATVKYFSATDYHINEIKR